MGFLRHSIMWWASGFVGGGEGEEWGLVSGGGWATSVAALLMLAIYLVRISIPRFKTTSQSARHRSLASSSPASIIGGKESLISDLDLKWLLGQLDESNSQNEDPWEFVIEKKNERVGYYAKRRDPKDGGPTHYLSSTTFENCTPEQVRDFYLDSDYRVTWDKTVVSHEQLQVSEETGIEIGRTVKKFPFLTPREYVLAWRVWEAENQTYYCVIKTCEHELAPRTPKYKRVETYLSGWKICKAPGGTASEIKMFHQEDAGMRRDMDKVAFSRGIWSYVCKMETNLRRFLSSSNRVQQEVNALIVAKKVPAEFYDWSKSKRPIIANVETQIPNKKARKPYGTRSWLPDKWSKKWVASGILFGGAFFCARSAPLGAKVAALCLVKSMINSKTKQKEAGDLLSLCSSVNRRSV